ncbi:hypothetical protein CU097_015744, partial [Rhizopus azygosporus]
EPLKNKKERLPDYIFSEVTEEDLESGFTVEVSWAPLPTTSHNSSRHSSDDFKGLMLTDLIDKKRSRDEEET